MKNGLKSVIALAVLAATSTFACADPIDDATFIVDSTLTREYFAESLEQVSGLMVGFMQNELRKQGKEMSNDASEVLSDMMLEAMLEGMQAGMRSDMAEAYVLNFSPDTLAAYRAFLETPAGRELASKQGVIVAEAGKIGEEIGGELGLQAVQKITDDLAADRWPEGTLSSTKTEIANLFEE